MTQILTPTTGTLSLAGNTPSIKQTLVPSTGTLSLSGNSPTITFSIIPHDRYYAYAESLSRTTTNTTDWSTLNLTLDFTPRANSSYVILWSLLVDNDVTGNHLMQAQLWDDTASAQLAMLVEIDGGPTTHNVVPLGGAAPITYGASPPSTQRLQIYTNVSDAALTMGVSEVNIAVLELVPNIDGQAYSPAQSFSTTTAWASKLTYSGVFNANTTSDYLAIISAETQSNVGEVRVCTNVDAGTFLNVHDRANYTGIASWDPYNALVYLPGITAGSSHSIAIQFASATPGDQVTIQNACITVLNLSAFLNAYADEDRTLHTSVTTSDADSASVTATPEAADHLILAAGQTTTSAAANTTSTRQKVNIGGSDIGTVFAELPGWGPNDTTGYKWSWWFTRKRTEANTSTTWKTRYARSTGSANAISDEHVIAALRLEAPGITTLHPTTGILAFTGNTPTTTTTLRPTTGTLALVGNSPTINVAIILTPTTGILSLAGNTPSLSLGFGPATGTLALAGNTAFLSQTLVPGTGTLALVGNTPSISVGTIAPTYSGTGIYSRQNGDVSLTPGYPASPASGDIFVLQFAHRNVTAQASATYGVPGDWTQLAAPIAQSSSRHFSYYKVSDGTETGTITITVTNGTATGIHQAAIHKFSGAAIDFTEGVNSSQGPNTTATADAGVTTTDTNRLAINLVFNNNALDIVSFTGESGGDWIARSKSNSAFSCSIGVQTADMPSAGTVDGGTITPIAGLWSVRGFALRPVAGGVILDPTTGTLALSGNTPSLSLGVGPTTGTLALSGNSPSITETIAPTTGTLALVGNAPSISVNQLLQPTTGTLALVGNTPILGVGLGPVTGTLELTGNIPSLSTALTPTTGTLAFVGNIPDVSVTAAVVITPTTGTLSLVGNTPSLKVILAAATGTLDLVGNPPTLTRGYAPTTGVLSLVGNAPTLATGIVLSPSTGTLSLAGDPGDPPTISITLRLTPSTGVLALIGNRPTIFGQEIRSESSEGAQGGGKSEKWGKALEKALRRAIKRGKKKQRDELFEKFLRQQKKEDSERIKQLDNEIEELDVQDDLEAGHYSSVEDWRKLHEEHEEWKPQPSRDEERRQQLERRERERELKRKLIEAKEEKKRAVEKAKEDIIERLSSQALTGREKLSIIILSGANEEIERRAQEIIRVDVAQRPDEEAIAILMLADL